MEQLAQEKIRTIGKFGIPFVLSSSNYKVECKPLFNQFLDLLITKFKSHKSTPEFISNLKDGFDKAITALFNNDTSILSKFIEHIYDNLKICKGVNLRFEKDKFESLLKEYITLIKDINKRDREDCLLVLSTNIGDSIASAAGYEEELSNANSEVDIEISVSIVGNTPKWNFHYLPPKEELAKKSMEELFFTEGVNYNLIVKDLPEGNTFDLYEGKNIMLTDKNEPFKLNVGDSVIVQYIPDLGYGISSFKDIIPVKLQF